MLGGASQLAGWLGMAKTVPQQFSQTLHCYLLLCVRLYFVVVVVLSVCLVSFFAAAFVACSVSEK